MREHILPKSVWLSFGATYILSLWCHQALATDFKASVAYIPLLAESSEKGAFIELTQAINAQYKEGDISIKVYPMARSLNNVVVGRADFHLPMVRSPYVSADDIPYRFASLPMGTVCFVIYSHKDKPITREMLLTNKSVTPFPYSIETLRGLSKTLQLPFPINETSKIEQSLTHVIKKRVDALIFAQEETDFLIRKLDMSSIHRSLFACWDDVIVIAKGKKGDAIDKVITKALKELGRNGILKALRKKIHVPYIDWQPF